MKRISKNGITDGTMPLFDEIKAREMPLPDRITVPRRQCQCQLAKHWTATPVGAKRDGSLTIGIERHCGSRTCIHDHSNQAAIAAATRRIGTSL
jgi:hypothetical protein